VNWKSKCQFKFLSLNAKLILIFVCPTFYRIKLISNDLIFSFCIYFLIIIKDSSKAISGGMSLWYVMNAWHIAVFKFERIVTKISLIQFTFLSHALMYWRCSSKVWFCPTSCVTLIFSIPSIRILLFLFVKSMTWEKTLLYVLLIVVSPCASVVGA
jgi:hypothetical protein